jgi:fatty-acyl-CoA synthase
VIVRGPNVLAEYWRNPDATAEVLREGWFHTGDIGVRDADGHFQIHDRKKNLIISGGENIYPAEVERVLGQHPAIAECAVIARADAKWQEVPVAYIVPRAGAKAEPAEIEQFCLRELTRYKVPREYVFVESLPRNAMGKVQHFKLKELLAETPREPGKAAEQTRDEDRRSGRWQWLTGGSR